MYVIDAPQATTEQPPVIGFTDPAGRFYPTSFTPSRLATLLDIGIDLATAVTSERELIRVLADGGHGSLIRMVQCALVAAGGVDRLPHGIPSTDGELITLGAFGQMMHSPRMIDRVTAAVFSALAAYFPRSAASVLASRLPA